MEFFPFGNVGVLFAWPGWAGAGVVHVTSVGARCGAMAFVAYVLKATGSIALWYGWKLTHRTLLSLYVSVSRTIMWFSSMPCRYRAGVALCASFDICFRFANSGTMPSCPSSRNCGMSGVAFVHMVYGRVLIPWWRILLYLKAASLTASSQCVLGSEMW